MNKQLAIVLAVAAACLVAAGVLWSRPKVRNFSESAWKAASRVSKPSNPDNPRAALVDDLLKNHLKPGTSKEDALALLGQPDQQRGANSARYNIGAYKRRALLSGSDQLVVEFDEEGRVKTAWIAAD